MSLHFVSSPARALGHRGIAIVCFAVGLLCVTGGVVATVANLHGNYGPGLFLAAGLWAITAGIIWVAAKHFAADSRLHQHLCNCMITIVGIAALCGLVVAVITVTFVTSFSGATSPFPS